MQLCIDQFQEYQETIICWLNEDIDLVEIFQTLDKNLTKNEKHFNRFRLSNHFITELKENTFSDITFESIEIAFCSKLKSIHVNAFNTTDQVTTSVKIIGNPLLTSPDNSIFEVLSKFIKANVIELSENNITEIPTNAFRYQQDRLKQLKFSGESF